MKKADISRDECRKMLQRAAIFQHVPDELLMELAERLDIKSIDTDETIIHKGEEGKSMFLIIRGSVRVHDGSYEVARLDTGNVFGELSLMDSYPRSMSVSAVEPTVLGTIHEDDFYRVMKVHPVTLKNIVSVLSFRLRHQNDTLIANLRSREQELEAAVSGRTADLNKKNEELEFALKQLKETQNQLVMREKLASLGQLTAGIAHEIKNPLNFVNNFSLLSFDLIEEIRNAATREEQNKILIELNANLERIHHHGKRADTIVKSMLDHSRSGSTEKQLTDINRLCEENFNLASVGMKANHPGFTCEQKKALDVSVPEINIIPQDIARVLLNLFNNAFYAVNEKVKINSAAGSKGDAHYVPLVSVSSLRQKNYVAINIRDNGNGIPENIRAKIFEPFYTTKPSGEGTGLGLSLSHDIIKAHGGEIRVESKPGEGTTFIINLPLT